MTLFSTASIVIVLFSGCATQKVAVVGGVEDLIRVPKGSVIGNVPIPTHEENNTYDIITQKDGIWISLDGFNRIEKTKGI